MIVASHLAAVGLQQEVESELEADDEQQNPEPNIQASREETGDPKTDMLQ